MSSYTEDQKIAAKAFVRGVGHGLLMANPLTAPARPGEYMASAWIGYASHVYGFDAASVEKKDPRVHALVEAFMDAVAEDPTFG